MNPTILTHYIDTLFAALEKQYPWAAGILAWTNTQTDALAVQVAANLGNIAVAGADLVLTALIDAANASGHKLLAGALAFVKTLVDQMGASQLPRLTVS